MTVENNVLRLWQILLRFQTVSFDSYEHNKDYFRFCRCRYKYS